MGPTFSLAGVLVGAIGGFVVATTYDHQRQIERTAGIAIGVFLMVVGIGMFVAGWWL